MARHPSNRPVALVGAVLVLTGGLVGCGSADEPDRAAAATSAGSPASTTSAAPLPTAPVDDEPPVTGSTPEAAVPTPTPEPTTTPKAERPSASAATPTPDASATPTPQAVATPKATRTPSADTELKPGTGMEVDRAFLRQYLPHSVATAQLAQFGRQRARHDELRRWAQDLFDRGAEEGKDAVGWSDALKVRPGSGGDAPTLARDARAMAIDPAPLTLTWKTLRGSPDPFEDTSRAKYDRAFLGLMIEHQEGLITMTEAELRHGKDRKVKAFAGDVRRDRRAMVKRLKTWRAAW